MKVTTSCLARFHVFDQAKQLEKHSVLHKLITGYPKYLTKKWGFCDNKIHSLFINGMHSYITNKISSYAPKFMGDLLRESVHNFFSSRLSRCLPLDSDIFIGLSSFCRDALIKAKKEGIIAIVDHGSLHERTEREILQEECEKFGFKPHGNWSQDWLIEKMDAEFAIADYVFVLSNIAKLSMIKNGVSEEKVFVNNCGVNISWFYPGVKDDKVFRVIQCSSIIPRKGIHYLLKAFYELNLPNSELWLIGGGLEKAMKDRSFKEIIKKYERPNILFKGTFPQAKLRELYIQGSVFVLASLADGFGMVIPQAMACGLPVITTENVGATDIIADGNNGYIIPAKNVDALKEKLLFLYENQDICVEMGKEGLRSVCNGYTWDDYGHRLLDFLNTVYRQKVQGK